jgi:hypothetical protein
VKEEAFKKCPMCSTVWQNRDKFIKDKSLEINGYQANFSNLKMGFFYFTHKVDGCYSTMVVEAKEFYDLNSGVRYPLRKTLTEECPAYCLHKDNLEKCSAECECAFVRDLILILQTMKHEEKVSD